MKRSWIGGAVLLLLLLGSLLVSCCMIRVHEPIARDLITAGEYALAGDWARALPLSRQAEENWEAREVLRACFADHNPMEEVDACFAQLEVFGRMQEETAFAAACAETAKKVAAMAEAHRLMWNTFF